MPAHVSIGKHANFLSLICHFTSATTNFLSSILNESFLMIVQIAIFRFLNKSKMAKTFSVIYFFLNGSKLKASKYYHLLFFLSIVLALFLALLKLILLTKIIK